MLLFDSFGIYRSDGEVVVPKSVLAMEKNKSDGSEKEKEIIVE